MHMIEKLGVGGGCAMVLLSILDIFKNSKISCWGFCTSALARSMLLDFLTSDLEATSATQRKLTNNASL